MPSSVMFIKDTCPSEAIDGGHYKVNKTEVLKKKMKKGVLLSNFYNNDIAQVLNYCKMSINGSLYQIML